MSPCLLLQHPRARSGSGGCFRRPSSAPHLLKPDPASLPHYLQTYPKSSQHRSPHCLPGHCPLPSALFLACRLPAIAPQDTCVRLCPSRESCPGCSPQGPAPTALRLLCPPGPAPASLERGRLGAAAEPVPSSKVQGLPRCATCFKKPSLPTLAEASFCFVCGSQFLPPRPGPVGRPGLSGRHASWHTSGPAPGPGPHVFPHRHLPLLIPTTGPFVAPHPRAQASDPCPGSPLITDPAPNPSDLTIVIPLAGLSRPAGRSSPLPQPWGWQWSCRRAPAGKSAPRLLWPS